MPLKPLDNVIGLHTQCGKTEKQAGVHVTKKLIKSTNAHSRKGRVNSSQ